MRVSTMTKKQKFLFSLFPLAVLILYMGIVGVFANFISTSVRAQIFGNLLVVLIGGGWYIWRRRKYAMSHPDSKKFQPRAWSVFLLVGLLIVFSVVTPIVGFAIQYAFPDSSGQVAYDAAVAADTGWFVLQTVFLAPIAEELVFRQYMFRPWKRTLGFWVSAALSSAVFALMHGTLYHLPVAFAVGFLSCVMLQMTGQLRYSFLVHFVFNLCAVSVTPGVLPLEGSLLYAWYISIPIYLVCFASVLLLYRYRRQIRKYVTEDHLIDKWNQKPEV